MGVLDKDIAAYSRRRNELEAEHLKQWVVFHKGLFEGVFADFEPAFPAFPDRGSRMLPTVVVEF